MIRTDASPEPRGISWRDPIVWVLALPLLIAIGGGVVFIRLAVTEGDRPLPQTMERRGPIQYGDPIGIRAAAALGIRATLVLDPDSLRVTLSGWPMQRPAPALTLHFWHRTDASRDQTVRLQAEGGAYRAPLPAPALPESVLLRIDPGDGSAPLELTGRLGRGDVLLRAVEDA